MPAKRKPQVGDVVMILPMSTCRRGHCHTCYEQMGTIGIVEWVREDTGWLRIHGGSDDGIFSTLKWRIHDVEVLQHASA